MSGCKLNALRQNAGRQIRHEAGWIGGLHGMWLGWELAGGAKAAAGFGEGGCVIHRRVGLED